MKKILFTGCIIFLSICSKAQLDTIPNASFENWYFAPNNTIQATGWHTNNSSIAAWNVTPDSISHSGILSLKIDKVSYRGIIWSGFPITNHPLSMDGYMKNYLSLGDTAIISIQVYSSNVLVDSGYAEIYGGIATVFLPFTVNISQNASVADSCVITLTGGNMSGSISWFDDLSFSFPNSVEELGSNEWTIFPNPVKDKFTIYDLRFTISKIEIYNVLGVCIFSRQPEANSQKQLTMDISNLRAGIYILTLRSGKGTMQTRIVKN